MTDAVFDLVVERLENHFGLAYYQPKFVCQQVIETCRCYSQPAALTKDAALEALSNLYHDIENSRGNDAVEQRSLCTLAAD